MRVVMGIDQFKSMVDGLYNVNDIYVNPSKDRIEFSALDQSHTMGASLVINRDGLKEYSVGEKENGFGVDGFILRKLARTIKSSELKVENTVEMETLKDKVLIRINGSRIRELYTNMVHMEEPTSYEQIEGIIKSVGDMVQVSVLTKDLKEILREASMVSKDEVVLATDGERLWLETKDEINRYRTGLQVYMSSGKVEKMEKVLLSYGLFDSFVKSVAGAGSEAVLWIKSESPVIATVSVSGGIYIIALAPRAG